ncbi:MAG: SUMF1/EgtB/PvdO family nonheme iron enzyme, partial [Spongiibacteraceae bacterium]|nr:SUMF1/EgtB/PvdO family nonheme iron enzyme [Spongiibacteraceae bacterium]
GQTLTLDIVKLEPASAWLQLTTIPSRANVTFDDSFKGQTPLRISVSPDKTHRLAIFKAGYQHVNRELTLDSGEKKSLALKLKPRLASVTIQTNPVDARLYIGGKLVGTGKQTLQLPAYRQVLEVRKAGYQSQRHAITPRPGFEQSMKIRLLTEHQAKWAKVKPRLISAAGQQLLLFHPNKFTMGASRREAGRRSNETLVSVDMTRAFYLSNKEVTNAQFREFSRGHSSGHVEGQSLDGDQQPVVNVSWMQAAVYCNWLSERDALTPFYQINSNQLVVINRRANGYRLPTEAEWAWAARTQKNKTLLKFPWGAQLPPPDASGNYADSDSAAITGRAIAGYQDGFMVTAPVGSFVANSLALFDMGGNVSEWVNDYYGLSTQGVNKIIRNPLGPDKGEYRVIRGSSWAHATVTELRLSYRDYGLKAKNDLGFRVARYVESAMDDKK